MTRHAKYIITLSLFLLKYEHALSSGWGVWKANMFLINILFKSEHGRQNFVLIGTGTSDITYFFFKEVLPG